MVKPHFFSYSIYFLFLWLVKNDTQQATIGTIESPLAAYSAEWNNEKYLSCNTAANVSYMNKTEKETIYILNLARSNPRLFANTVILQYPQKTNQPGLTKSSYYISLQKTMRTMSAQQILFPDSLCYISAFYHATSSGRQGYVGHERQNKESRKKQYLRAECCQYGNTDALKIVVELLIDDGIPSLGHREICFSNYTKIGVSHQPHKSYGVNTVMDFH